MTKEVMQQALEALESDNPYIQQLAANAIEDALKQPVQKPVAWDKPSASFNSWWDSDRHDNANPFEPDSAAYWAWKGWQAAQRPWQGLTIEEIGDIFNNTPNPTEKVGPFVIRFFRAIEAKLKEKNNG